ncbi:MAG TPA: hypothetical protein VJX16_12930 [Terriglobales bacterium]|nr:hypothetical protein [Terriglobales bacterium]
MGKGTVLGLQFAGRGGTATSSMLAQITEVSARIVLRNDSSVLQFSLRKARFEYGPVTVLRMPAREGLAQVDGLHVWLESGHWLFICDIQGQGQKWLEFATNSLQQNKAGGSLESQPEAVTSRG